MQLPQCSSLGIHTIGFGYCYVAKILRHIHVMTIFKTVLVVIPAF